MYAKTDFIAGKNHAGGMIWGVKMSELLPNVSEILANYMIFCVSKRIMIRMVFNLIDAYLVEIKRKNKIEA